MDLRFDDLLFPPQPRQVSSTQSTAPAGDGTIRQSGTNVARMPTAVRKEEESGSKKKSVQKGKGNKESELAKKEGSKDAVKAKKAIKIAERIVQETDAKAYKRVPNHVECLARLLDLSQTWTLFTKGSVFEDERTMEGVTGIVDLWKNESFRNGISVISDVSVNLVDYLCRRKIPILEFEAKGAEDCDGRIVTLPTQTLMSK